MSKTFNEIRKSIEWGGKTLTISTGKMAKLAQGAVVAEYGKTVVLCVVSAAKQPKEGIDFFPLTVNYIDKFYASGRIPGGHFKREGKPTERETLNSRLIDRPIRPLFPQGFFNEVQICCTVLSYDPECESDVVALIGASAALWISGVPFLEPIAGARVGYIDGQYVLNPTSEQLALSQLDLAVAGTESSVLMVESEAQQLSEQVMLEAVMYGHQHCQPVIEMIKQFATAVGNERWKVELKDYKDLETKLLKAYKKDLETAYATADKATRRELLAEIKAKAIEQFAKEGEVSEFEVGMNLKQLEKTIVRSKLVHKQWRIDGRSPDTIRPIACEVGLLPQTHGSALFTRGETQALAVITLGTGQDEQLIDDVSGNFTQKFMLHYNFPPYSVGETAPLRPPSRRDIGHGKLAFRALKPVLPQHENFPYTIRLVSEILESNGSSSMATVCGGALAMMDAGIPITTPVAGIAMGLVLEGADFVVLSDILGDEDNLGDMDFKVAGTAHGITALQMDIKINGITHEIMEVALAKAKVGRLHILEKMVAVLKHPREELNENAPRITTIKIDKDKIRDVIGSGGKVIRELCERANAKIDIEDDGTIKVATVSAADTELVLKLIGDIVAVPEIGKIYEGKVVKIADFGAFVNYLGNLEGLLHISEMGGGERVAKVTDVLSEGDMVKVKVLSVEKNGKVRLSMNLDSVPGEGGSRSEKPRDRDRRPNRDEGRRSPDGKRRDNREGRFNDRHDDKEHHKSKEQRHERSSSREDEGSDKDQSRANASSKKRRFF